METTKGRAPARLFVTALVTAALALGLLAATSLSPAAVGQAHAASISKKSVTLVKGKSCTLKVKGAKAKKVKWSSSKKSVATVSKKGVVKAKKPGKATITAKYKKKKFKCKVTVKAAAKPVVTPAKPPVTPEKPPVIPENPVVFDSSLGSAVLPAEGDTTSEITFTGKGEVNVSSSNPAVAKATWISSWVNDKRTLLIEALIPGKAVIKLTNTQNSSEIDIEIDVEAWGVVSESTVIAAVKAAGENGKLSWGGWVDYHPYECVIKENVDRNLEFVYTAKDTNHVITGITTMKLKPGDMPYVIYDNEVANAEFRGTTYLNKSKYEMDQDVVWAPTFGSMTADKSRICNRNLSCAMRVWQETLKLRTSFDFSNLGFANL